MAYNETKLVGVARNFNHQFSNCNRDATCTLLSLGLLSSFVYFLYYHPYFTHQFHPIVFILVIIIMSKNKQKFCKQTMALSANSGTKATFLCGTQDGTYDQNSGLSQTFWDSWHLCMICRVCKQYICAALIEIARE